MPINGPKQVANQQISALHADSTVRALVVHAVDASGAYVSPGAGSTQVSVREIQTSAGASVMDSTNNSIGVTIRAGSAAGTEYVDGDVDATPNGGVVFFNNSSNTMRAVSAATPLPVSGTFSASTIVTVAALPLISTAVAAANSSAMNVRVVGGVSSAVDFPVRALFSSTKADNLISVYQSSAAELQATVTPAAGSTWAVRPLQSSAADLQATVTPVAGSTWNVRPLQSSAADLQVTATQGGTWNIGTVTTITGVTTVSSVAGVVMARLQDSSGVGIAGSTGPTAIGVNGLVTREVMPALLSTTVLITSTHSTALYALISSAAGLRQKVYAYFVSSTHTVPSTLVFMSSNAIDRWHVGFGSGSSGMSGANLAMSPPAWLFHTDVANALNVRIEGGSSVTSTVIARISISYFSEA